MFPKDWVEWIAIILLGIALIVVVFVFPYLMYQDGTPWWACAAYFGVCMFILDDIRWHDYKWRKPDYPSFDPYKER